MTWWKITCLKKFTGYICKKSWFTQIMARVNNSQKKIEFFYSGLKYKFLLSWCEFCKQSSFLLHIFPAQFFIDVFLYKVRNGLNVLFVGRGCAGRGRWTRTSVSNKKLVSFWNICAHRLAIMNERTQLPLQKQLGWVFGWGARRGQQYSSGPDFAKCVVLQPLSAQNIPGDEEERLGNSTAQFCSRLRRWGVARKRCSTHIHLLHV